MTRATAPVGEGRPGFYDGLHGVAYALEALGRSRDALDVLDGCTAGLRRNLDEYLETASLDLYGGLAGIGLNLDHFAEVTGDPQLAGLAARVTQAVADRLGGEESAAARGDHPRTGLLRGSSGPALLFIRRYERTGEAWLLDLAAAALRQDLRRCVLRTDGRLEVDRGWRTAPCLGDGSAGIGLVVDDYLAYRSDGDLVDAAVGIRTAATTTSPMQPGLFNGRAGMILHLSRSLARRLHGSMTPHPLVEDQLARLPRHGLPSQAEPALGGDHRRSMDLATGAAGVLLGIGAAMHDGAVGLPFLGPLLFCGVHDAVHLIQAGSRYRSTGRR